MSAKNKKQFGIWMDSQHAVVVGRKDIDSGDFVVLGHAKNTEPGGNSNENTANNAEKMHQQKFFKEISAMMQNAEELHVTGTGDAQEQFRHFMAATPQFRDMVSVDSTSNRMDDEKLLLFIAEKFN